MRGIENPRTPEKEYLMKKYEYNKYTLRVNDEQKQFIKNVAKSNGISETNAIRLMISAYGKECARYGR